MHRAVTHIHTHGIHTHGSGPPVLQQRTENDPADFVSGIDLSNIVDDTIIRIVPETPLSLVHNVFRQLGLRFVMVVSQGRLKGLITKKAFVKYMHENHGSHHNTFYKPGRFHKHSKAKSEASVVDGDESREIPQTPKAEAPEISYMVKQAAEKFRLARSRSNLSQSFISEDTLELPKGSPRQPTDERRDSRDSEEADSALALLEPGAGISDKLRRMSATLTHAHMKLQSGKSQSRGDRRKMASGGETRNLRGKRASLTKTPMQ